MAGRYSHAAAVATARTTVVTAVPVTREGAQDNAAVRRAPAGVVSIRHFINCVYCQQRFDLFAARWCGHLDPEPSKICPSCEHCLCDHPAYHEPHFWKEAPLA